MSVLQSYKALLLVNDAEKSRKKESCLIVTFISIWPWKPFLLQFLSTWIGTEEHILMKMATWDVNCLMVQIIKHPIEFHSFVSIGQKKMGHFLWETHKILLIETEMQFKDIAKKKQNSEMFISSELVNIAKTYYKVLAGRTTKYSKFESVWRKKHQKLKWNFLSWKCAIFREVRKQILPILTEWIIGVKEQTASGKMSSALDCPSPKTNKHSEN